MSSLAKKRKYYENYIQYGFTDVNKNEPQFPQCVLCCKVLSVGCMKPAFLKRHLNGCHPNHKSKGTVFFKQKEDELKRARLDRLWYISQQNEVGLRASYVLRLHASYMAIMRFAREKISQHCKEINHPLL